MSYLKHKKGSLEDAVLEAVKTKSEDNTNDKSDDGEGLDKVQPKAVKKKFKDRKDKDIDNDGDVDDSDRFLHKRRKAISKAIKKEGNKFGATLKLARANGDKEMVVGGKKYPVKDVEGENRKKYHQYKKLIRSNMTFIGRCGMYVYIDMHQAISSALYTAKKFLENNK